MRPWSLFAASASSLLILLAAPAQYLGRQQDDLFYVMASQGLLSGHYTLWGLPRLPFLGMVSPGWPALLLPVSIFFKGNLAAYQAASALVLAASPWLFRTWAKSRGVPESASALMILAFATSPLVLSQSGCVMSEAPYLAAAFLLLLAADRPRSPEGKGRAALIGALAFAASQIRMAGAILLPAAAAPALSRARLGKRAAAMELLIVLGPALIGLALWSLYSRARSGTVQKLSELAFAYGGGLSSLAPAVAGNLRGYLLDGGRSFLPPAAPAALAIAAGAAVFLAALRGLALTLRKDPLDPAAWALAASLLLYAFWPWNYQRYLMTLLPWLLWCAREGLGRAAAPVLAALALGQALFFLPIFLRHPTPLETPHLRETYRWIQARTAPGAVLGSPLYARDGFLARRPSLPIPDADSAALFAARLKKEGIEMVLWPAPENLGFSDPGSSPIAAVLARDGGYLKDEKFFRLIHEDPAEGSRLYAVKRK